MVQFSSGMKFAAPALLISMTLSTSALSADATLPDWSRVARDTGTPLRKFVGADSPDGWAFGKKDGQPKAILICLHGIQTHADWFAPLGAEAEREGWLLLCPDRRGSGRARADDRIARLEPLTIGGEVWAEELRPLFEKAREIDAPIFLVGTSWGAKVALYAAAERATLYPGVNLRSLILLVPATPAKKETFFAKLVITVFHSFKRDKIFGGLTQAEYQNRGADAAQRERLRENMQRDHQLLECGQTVHLLHEGLRLEKEGLARLGKSPLPTLALFADGDEIVDLNRAPVATRNIGAEVHTLASAGHAVQVEAPGSIVAVLRPWVKAHAYP